MELGGVEGKILGFACTEEAGKKQTPDIPVVVKKHRANLNTLPHDLLICPCLSKSKMCFVLLRQRVAALLWLSSRLDRSSPSSLSELQPSARHMICPLEAPVTLKKLISVSLNVYIEVHCILCNSHGTFQKSVRCPCHRKVTLLKLLTALIMMANLVSGFETSKTSQRSLCGVAFGAWSTSVGGRHIWLILMQIQDSVSMSFMSTVCLQPFNPNTPWSPDSLSHYWSPAV